MIIKLKAILIKNMIIQELETVGRDTGKGEIRCFLLFMGEDFSVQMVSWSLTKKYWGQIKILTYNKVAYFKAMAISYTPLQCCAWTGSLGREYN